MLDRTCKPLFHQLETNKNIFLESWIFFRKMSHSAENPKESYMLAKRFVSCKTLGGFDKNKFEKRRIAPIKRRSPKKTKIWIERVGPLRKPNFKMKNNHFKNLTMPKIVKKGILWAS